MNKSTPSTTRPLTTPTRLLPPARIPLVPNPVIRRLTPNRTLLDMVQTKTHSSK